MTQEEVRKQLLRLGEFVAYTGPKKRKRTKVVCQGCGKDIFSDGSEILGCMITKRGSAFFWHAECEKAAWDNKIKGGVKP